MRLERKAGRRTMMQRLSLRDRQSPEGPPKGCGEPGRNAEGKIGSCGKFKLSEQVEECLAHPAGHQD